MSRLHGPDESPRQVRVSYADGAEPVAGSQMLQDAGLPNVTPQPLQRTSTVTVPLTGQLVAHPALRIFPSLSDQQYADLLEDIRVNGQRVPIVVYEGQILDGRARARACRELGLPVQAVVWDGRGSAVALIISLNLQRRHLSPSQAALAAAEIRPFFEAEARERQVAGLRRGTSRPVSANLRDRIGKSSQLAGAAFGVSSRLVDSGARVLKTGVPELVHAVRADRIPASVAEQIATQPSTYQLELIPMSPKEMRAALQVLREQKREEARAIQRAKCAALAATVPPVIDYSPTLFCCDVVEGLRRVEAGSVDLVCTDPPYFMNKAPWDKPMKPGDYVRWSRAWLRECYRILKPTGSLYVFGTCESLRYIPFIMDHLGFRFRREIIWDRISGIQQMNTWPWCHENIHVYTRSDHSYWDPESVVQSPYEKRVCDDESQPAGRVPLSDVWRFPPATGIDRTDHPTQKPLALIERIVRASCPPGGLVVDPFVGSGTTAAACMRNGRRSIGIDASEDYINIARARIAECAITLSAQTPGGPPKGPEDTAEGGLAA